MDNEAKILQMLEQMNGRLDSMQADISGLKDDVSSLKDDVSGLKDDVSGLKDDVSGLKDDASNLKSSFNKLNQTVARIEVDHGKKLSTLYDAHVDTVRNATTINALDAKVDNHDHRIFALEQKVSNG